MRRRSRDPKKLVERIDRHYFKGSYLLPRWRTRLALLAIAIGFGWLLLRGARRDQTAFSAGPVNSYHASFESNCVQCHALRTSMGSSVTDGACLSCHDGPIHHEQQTSTPRCFECHVEHRGAPRLLSSDKPCVTCHRALRVSAGNLTVAAHISSFRDGHPEFAALRPEGGDPATIKFNHKVHLRPDLRGPSGIVQLQCDDCHRAAGIAQPWPYGQQQPGEQPAALPVLLPRSRVSARARMQPVSYQLHCAGCHPLLFDARIHDPAPHKKPEIVVAFVKQKLESYIASHPGELGFFKRTATITRVNDLPPPRTAAGWIEMKMKEDERLLWAKTCAECHSLTASGTRLPTVTESNIAAAWLKRGDFDHAAHVMLDCAGCHQDVRKSEKTSDVLIPGIKVCQRCHDPEARHPAAGSTCFECHRYHDWSKEKPRHGHLEVR
jgi:hypothetical protein